MFDFVRHHTKLIMGLLFVLIIPSFVLFGIEGYTHFNEGASKVATVDGQSISQQEWDHAHRQEVERISAANPGIDVALLDTPEMKYATLERLVRERVLAAAAQKMHLVTTDAKLASQLKQDPFIASLNKPDGTLDMALYQQTLARQGLTPEGFENGVRADLSARQVLAGLVQSGFVPLAQADAALSAFLERREAQVLRLAPADFASQVKPTDADLEAFYKSHLADYQVPERVDIEYVVLDLDSIKKGLSVSEQELKTYYDQNAASMGTKEERRASHILVVAPKDAPAAEREKAKAEAAKLLAELRQSPDSFAAVAKRASQDDTSAASGGDLGFFQQDRGIDPAIAKAAFALGKGEISDVVESDFGYHIARLTDIKPAVVPSFEQMRPKLEDQLRTQQAQRLFAEQGETFRNDVYEQADSLQPAADKLKLAIQTASGLSRTPAPGAVGPLAHAPFLSALFAADALDKKNNTEAIEFAPGQLVAGRVSKHMPAHARPFEEVKAAVRERFIAERAAELARKDGAAKLAAWQAQPASATGLPAAVVLSRDNAQGQPARLVEAVLRADAAKLPAFVGVDLGSEGYALARVGKVLPRAADEANDATTQARQQYEQAWGAAEALAYYDQLKARFKAEILAPEPAPGSAAGAN
ncbi:MAG: SurA N-terminal domain-containing protein [Comamonadaceae bacterium]|nr:SurA N-terminal domain-containing protein [Comamonadaceae bacterium]